MTGPNRIRQGRRWRQRPGRGGARPPCLLVERTWRRRRARTSHCRRGHHPGRPTPVPRRGSAQGAEAACAAVEGLTDRAASHECGGAGPMQSSPQALSRRGSALGEWRMNEDGARCARHFLGDGWISSPCAERGPGSERDPGLAPRVTVRRRRTPALIGSPQAGVSRESPSGLRNTSDRPASVHRKLMRRGSATRSRQRPPPAVAATADPRFSTPGRGVGRRR